MDKVRGAIRQEVAALEPLDDTEKRHIDIASAWIDSGAALFRTKKPDVPIIHLVAYFVIFDVQEHAVLLVHHRLAGKWLPTGGHVDPDELPAISVERECQEEVGLPAVFWKGRDATFITVTEVHDAIDGRPTTHTDVSLWYVLSAKTSDPLVIEEKAFAEVRWWKLDDILQLSDDILDPNFRRFIQKCSYSLFTPA